MLDALVTTEVALVRAWVEVGVAPTHVADAAERTFGWDGEARTCRAHGIDSRALAVSSAGPGNPVIALRDLMRTAAPDAAAWIHRGATSQDILDTALMRVATDAAREIGQRLDATCETLDQFAARHRDTTAAARTLTQHAVPTTAGLRATQWSQAIARAAGRIEAAAGQTPAQLGGAAGTLASFVEIARTATDHHEPYDEESSRAIAGALPATLAARIGLAAPSAPWHTVRWPVTELGDALVQAIDALGMLSADVATLSRTEIGELSDSAPGGSSAMPHKRNPVAAVLIRSAAVRAPFLGATLHACAAQAVDERPDGAWHAEWPTLQELLRLALSCAARAVTLAEGLTLDEHATARNLTLAGTDILSERLTLTLSSRLGQEQTTELLRGIDVREAGPAGDSARSALRARLETLPELHDVDLDSLLDPAQATGLSAQLVDEHLQRRSGQ